MVILEEAIIQVGIEGLSSLNLVESAGNVALISEILRSNLSDVQVNEESVVTIKFPLLLGGQASGVNVVALGDMLVRDNVLWLTEFVTWSSDIEDSKVIVTLLFIDLEEEVFLGDDLSVSLLLEGFFV